MKMLGQEDLKMLLNGLLDSKYLKLMFLNVLSKI
jgi:hypothetical protein